MDPNLRLAAAAAVVLLVAGTALAILSRAPAVGVNPTPTASPSASPQAIVDPSLLEAKWTSVGGRRDPIFTDPATTETTDMIIYSTTISIDQFKGYVDSTWTQVAPDNHLVLEMRSSQSDLTSQHWDCQPGQAGTYTVGLSADERTLTMSSVQDACPARAAILAGDWTRWPCPNPNSTCQPELSPGRHVWTDPTLDGNGQPLPPQPLSGYSFTVPAGWSQLTGGTLGRPNDPGTMVINEGTDVAAHSQNPDCPDAVEPGVGSTATALADWLSGLPGLVTTKPTPIRLSGFDGVMIDVSVAPDWTIPCRQFYAVPERVVFTFTDPVPTPGGAVNIRSSVDGDAHSRYILLDIGKGHNLLIEIAAPDKASWDEFVQAAMPIVDTFQFVR